MGNIDLLFTQALPRQGNEALRFMDLIQNLYLTFLANFPENLRPIISLGLAILIVYSVFKIVKKDFIFIIVLVVLLPGSIPILKSIWSGVVGFVRFLLNAG